MKLVFLGPPGAGKGTQAVNISKRFGVPHISTGDMFRYAMEHETETGLRAKAYIDKGHLVPDQIVIDMVKERLSMPDAQAGFLLDGFPRSVHQAEALEDFKCPDAVVNIAVLDEVLVERLAARRVCRVCGRTFHVDKLSNGKCPVCGGEMYRRDDDMPETIRNRLLVYHEKSSPLIDYYSGKERLVTIDGDASQEAVGAEISRALEKLL